MCFIPRWEDVFKVQMLSLIVSQGICKLQKCQTCTWLMCCRRDNLDQRFCVTGDSITPLCERVTRWPRVLCTEDHGWGGVRMCGLAAPWPSVAPAGLLLRPRWRKSCHVAPGSGMHPSGRWSHQVPSTQMLKDVSQEEGVWFGQCHGAALSGSKWPTGAAASRRTSGSRLENHVLGRGVLPRLPLDAGTHSSKAESRHVTRTPRREGVGSV